MHVVQFSLDIHMTHGDKQSIHRLIPKEESMYCEFLLHVLQFYAVSWHDLHEGWHGKQIS